MVEQAFRVNGKLTPEQGEMGRLRKENRRLKMEKDILKKATVGMPHHFFAKETQFARKAYRGLLKANAFVGSISRKGDCWDNAVGEGFFASLKKAT